MRVPGHKELGPSRTMFLIDKFGEQGGCQDTDFLIK